MFYTESRAADRYTVLQFKHNICIYNKSLIKLCIDYLHEHLIIEHK